MKKHAIGWIALGASTALLGPGGSRSLRGCQASPWASERKLDPEGRSKQQIDLAGLNFLKIPWGDPSLFRKILLGHLAAHALAADIYSERPDPCPFFSM
jgi:hypothetical protein